MNTSRGFREVTWAWATTPNMIGSRLCPLGYADEDAAFWEECLARLEDSNRFPHAEGIILFENPDMWSSQHGARTVLPYGPENTIKAEDLPKIAANPMLWKLGEAPSRFEYPQWYISREAHLRAPVHA
jgi:hypothetical protein